ncbi:hypothetical protein HDG32_004024 [Paraburkholderia sp. CI2]|uniref:hypothetical protein n=1 Tax=Paraburkholderia sp. CI2 TaxID=2723093 RepID=UPI0017D66CA6|nr:hypothetical protein [Paraburkholderia sp. CI2]
MRGLPLKNLVGRRIELLTFTKRGDLQWQAKIRRKGYPQESKTFDTKADAEKWARSIAREMGRGRFVSSAEAESTTFTEALDRYEREIASHKRGATEEKSIIRQLRDSWLANRPLAAIRRPDIAKLRDEWCVTHSPATVVRRLAVAFFHSRAQGTGLGEHIQPGRTGAQTYDQE